VDRLRDHYGTSIDAINPITNQFVARMRIPESVSAFVAPGEIFSHREDANGDVVFEIWRLTLRR
jgi:hypothetical protein